MKRSTIIVLIIAVAFLAIVLIVGASGSSEPDVRYNYTDEAVEGFMGTHGYEKAKDGYVFVIVTIHAYNDRADSVSMSPLTWAWRVHAGGMEYSSDILTFLHPLYKSGNILKGYHERFAIVFQIPQQYADNYTIKEDYQWGYEKVVRDTSIVV